ncbi:hypothetical protein BJ875DRAFT_507051 [Amylocarpus encephaloides]|uniref:Uncharacterized protein n=1 Tax=Amylocarpus encephaloides TaxID=45428 RepID=A0A9P7YBG6_9HELO|nr:hypothetical protein BJ875DRAFT_507051 [Amylocarpus encephaloides]
MESTNPHHAFQSFTITQAFLGAPLQFVPALGSRQLEQLVDAYVLGAGTKSEKLSEVTIDFYNNATVDLSTGALVRSYNVCAASEQSPAQSQSSGISPSALHAPSPASSATLGDSGYGSMSLGMTPPNRTVGGRVAKKAKETKKVVEPRLPGFSIMTKDGVDVTSTAGRGTKTKEQREHAHLMRIIKACDACKKKKIRLQDISPHQ